MPSPLLLDVKMESIGKFSRFGAALAGRPVIDVNDGGDHPPVFHGVRYALVWKPAAELFRRLPDLEVLFSVGAGVDHVFACDAVPDVPIVRFVDPSLTGPMSEWVVLQCLMHLRQQRQYDGQQRAHVWHDRPQAWADEITVGIIGMGVLGQDAARKLGALGFRVIGWSRSGKPADGSLDGLAMHGAAELDVFLGKSDFLVGLLPLTAETRGIYNRSLFSKLRRGSQDGIAAPVFINAGRGGSQVEADIVACLEDGTLGGVSLDVFETEPLPDTSPLWDFDRAILTPHVAAASDMEALGRYVAAQIARHEAGEALENVVDRAAGY